MRSFWSLKKKQIQWVLYSGSEKQILVFYAEKKLLSRVLIREPSIILLGLFSNAQSLWRNDTERMTCVTVVAVRKKTVESSTWFTMGLTSHEVCVWSAFSFFCTHAVNVTLRIVEGMHVFNFPLTALNLPRKQTLPFSKSVSKPLCQLLAEMTYKSVTYRDDLAKNENKKCCGLHCR